MKLKLISAAILLTAAFAVPAKAQQVPTAEETYRQIEETLGGVPSHLKGYPRSAISGAWAMHTGLYDAETNELDFKVKSLISLAVAAQIPCEYCVWLETKLAKSAGATDEDLYLPRQISRGLIQSACTDCGGSDGQISRIV